MEWYDDATAFKHRVVETMVGSERPRERTPTSARTARYVRGAIGCLVLVALLVIVALMLERRAGTTPQQRPRPIGPHHLISPELPKTVLPTPAAAPAAAIQTRALRTANVCGLGPVTVKSDNPNLAIAVSTEVDRRVAKAAAAWIATLRNSDDLVVRAAGLLLDGHTVGDRTVTSMSAASGNALVQLAVGTDPAVYALAFEMCDTYRMTREFSAMKAECDQLSAARWSKIDPGNAVPWLIRARGALAAGDASAEADAIARVAQATQVNAYGDRLMRSLHPLMPTTLPAAERVALESDMGSYFDTWWNIPYGTVLNYCDQSPSADRKHVCAQIGALLMADGWTAMDVMVGLRLGERAGWSPMRIQEAKAQRNALFPDPSGVRIVPWSCQGLQLIDQIADAEISGGDSAGAQRARQLWHLPDTSISAKSIEFLERALDWSEKNPLPMRVVRQ